MAFNDQLWVESGRSLGHNGQMHFTLKVGVTIASIALLGCSSNAPQACTPPMSYWQKPHNFVGLMPLMNKVALDRNGVLYWNGSPISRSKLGSNLRSSHQMNPEPVVFLQTEMGTPCNDLNALRKQMDDALECKESRRCAEGIKSVWENLPSPPGPFVS